MPVALHSPERLQSFAHRLGRLLALELQDPQHGFSSLSVECRVIILFSRKASDARQRSEATHLIFLKSKGSHACAYCVRSIHEINQGEGEALPSVA